MISFPNCKINLGLRILNKRADGFHNIVSLFYPVNWCDALEMMVAPAFNFETAGGTIQGAPYDNICVKAFQLLQTRHGIPTVNMMLLKNIPAGAGLGGGSADGAFALKMLNELFELQLPDNVLLEYAGQLGSDCPFFLKNTPVLVTGKGELLQEVALNLSGYYLMMVFPGETINTGWAFGEFDKQQGHRQMQRESLDFVSQLKKPVAEWQQIFVNDFEPVVYAYYPHIGNIKSLLYASGARYASLSGSGSTVYGIFENEPPLVSFPENYRVHITQL